MLTKNDLFNIGVLFEERFAEVRVQLQDDILRFKDEILTELRSIREEHIVSSGAIARHNDEMEDLDIQVSALEDKGFPN